MPALEHSSSLPLDMAYCGSQVFGHRFGHQVFGFRLDLFYLLPEPPPCREADQLYPHNYMSPFFIVNIFCQSIKSSMSYDSFQVDSCLIQVPILLTKVQGYLPAFFFLPTNGKFSSEVTLISTQRQSWQNLSKIAPSIFVGKKEVKPGQK